MRTPKMLTSAIPNFYPDEAPPIAPATAPEVKGPEGTLYPEAAPEGEAPKTEQPATEEKPPEAAAEEKPAEEAGATAIEVKLPEGFEVKDEVLGEFKSLAAEAGLNSEAAQKLVDLYAKQAEAQANAIASAWNSTIETWKAELDKDPDLGGDKRAAAQTVLGRALDEYGSTEAREAFDATGAGWNPAIVRMIHKMATALSEGGPVGIGKPAGRTTTPAERLYGN